MKLQNRKSIVLMVLFVLVFGLCTGYWIKSLSPTPSTVVHWENIELQDVPLVNGKGPQPSSSPRVPLKVSDNGIPESRVPSPESGLFSGVIQIKDGDRLVPASRARVYWMRAPDNGRPSDTTLEDMEYLTADEAGRFAGVVSSDGGLFCYVTHPFGVPIAVGLAHAAEGNRLILDAASQIVVQVLNAGNPAKGRFRVAVMPVDPRSADGRQSMTFKGKDGRCLCQGVPAKWKKAKVQVLTEDERNLSVRRPVALRFARTEEVVVKYGGLVSLSGRVIDEGRAPVDAAEVYVYRTDPPKGASFRSATTTTDSAGRFSLDGLPAGSLSVRASRSGYASSIVIKELSGSERVDLGDFLLRKGFSIHGKVEDSGGGGVRSSEYRVGIRFLDSSKAFKDTEAGPYAGRWGSPDWMEGNRFRFDHMIPGLYRIAVIEGVPGNIRAAWTSVVVEARSEVKGLVLSVPKGVLWRGRVRSPGLASSKGMQVICRDVQGDWASFGKLGPAGTVEIRVRSFPFLLGVEMRSGPLRGLRWIGRVEQGVGEVKIPHGGILFDMSRGGHDLPSYLRLVHLKTPALGGYLGNLKANAPKLKPGTLTYKVLGLLPGSYRLEAFWFRHKETTSFEVIGSKERRQAWPFH